MQSELGEINSDVSIALALLSEIYQVSIPRRTIMRFTPVRCGLWYRYRGKVLVEPRKYGDHNPLFLLYQNQNHSTIMYDSEPVSNLVEEICYIVDSYIEYLEAYYSRSEDVLESSFDKDDAIIVYEKDGRFDFKVEHFKDYLLMDMGKVALSTLDRLVSNGDHDYDKVLDFVNTIAGHGIPNKIITKAEDLSKELHYSYYTIELHHTSSAGCTYYLCMFYDRGKSYIIKSFNESISVYDNIEPFAKSYIPNPVLDFLYPNPKEYTHVRYMGEYRGESIFYPCHEDTMYADGYTVPVYLLVRYNENTGKCHYITDDLAIRLYCKLDKEIDF